MENSHGRHSYLYKSSLNFALTFHNILELSLYLAVHSKKLLNRHYVDRYIACCIRHSKSQCTDLFHEGLHVLPLLEQKAPQVIKGDVSLHVLSKARVLHIELKLSIQIQKTNVLTQKYN